MKSFLLFLLPVYLFLVSEASIARHAAIVIDADTGTVLHEVEANQPWYPASLTKVMTLYMTFEALESGQIQLGSILKGSTYQKIPLKPKSKLGLRRGEKLTTRDAILAVITRSANDAAVVLAEAVGGTEDNFAAMMTVRARSLGMNNTRFMNATGLPNNWQITTARDLALLAWKIQRDFPSYYQYFSAHEFYFKGQTMRAINAFTAKYPGAEGMKTGFTCGSGYNLMASAHQNSQRLIGVVMGGMTSKERYQLMIQLMDNAFAHIYSANPDVNIVGTRPYSTSVPPYQLTCGNGASFHQAANMPSNGQGADTMKPVKNSKATYKTARLVKSKRVSKTNRLRKTKTSTKSVRLSKTKSVRKSTSLSKTKTRTRAKTAKPHHKAAASNKSQKTNKTKAKAKTTAMNAR